MRILLNRQSGIGDILILTSVVKALRKNNSGVEIDVCTSYPELWLGNKDVHQVVPYDVFRSGEERRYDKVIDFNFCVESPRVHPQQGRISERAYMNVPRVELFFKQANLDPKEFSGLCYQVQLSEKLYARKILSQFPHPRRKTVVYVLNSISPYRTYPVRYSLEVIRELVQEGYNVITVGTVKKIWGVKHPFYIQYREGVSTFDKTRFLDWTDLTSVRDVIALISESDCVITPDTSALHASAAVGTPCVALFGNIHPRLRCDRYPNVRPVFSCPPCLCGDRYSVIKEQCLSWEEIESPTIRRIGARCMEMITPKEVISEVKNII